MAKTTKKSPSAKIKTSKKPATKPTSTAKRSVATKVPKSSAAAKVVKPVRNERAKSPITQVLMRLNLIGGVLSLALAAAAGLLMNNSSYQLFTGMLAKDELASTTTTVFAPAIRSLYDIELRWVVVGILLLSAILPLLAATRLRKQYEASLVRKVMFWRWLEVGIVGGLILETVALLSGVQDVMVLKLVGGLVVVTCMLDWLSEKHNAIAAGTGRGNYVLSVITGVLPWLLIGAYAVGTFVFGMIRSPWYVYALYAVVALSFTAYCLNNLRNLKAKQSYEVTEKRYLQIGIFLKVAFAAILIAGLYKK